MIFLFEGNIIAAGLTRHTHVDPYLLCSFISVINTPTYNVMPRKKVNWAIWNALKMWSSVIPVSFRKVPSWQPADIVIKFASYYHGDSYPFDGPNGTIAHAYLPNGRFGDLDGDIHLDDSEAFNNHGRWGRFNSPLFDMVKPGITVLYITTSHVLVWFIGITRRHMDNSG